MQGLNQYVQNILVTYNYKPGLTFTIPYNGDIQDLTQNSTITHHLNILMIQDISNRKSRWMAPPVKAKQEQPKSGRRLIIKIQISHSKTLEIPKDKI